jgi:hypothetical protein
MMTFMDAIPFLEAFFPTSPPPVLDVAGENLPMTGYLVGTFAHFLLGGMARLSSSTVAPCHLSLVVPQAMLFGVAYRVVVFLLSLSGVSWVDLTKLE